MLILLTHKQPMHSSYRNQSIDLFYKLIDWFPYDYDIGRKWFKTWSFLSQVKISDNMRKSVTLLDSG